MVREVRSPNNTSQDHPRRAESPGSRSSPSNARADWGHVAHNLGKGGHRPASARRDSNSLVLGGFQSPLDPRDPMPRSDRR
jgi:hypothetical protein